VAASGLSEHFHAVSIVRQKDTKTLQELVSKLPFQADFYTVVGNNLETDMAPAAALGFRAVHYNNPNSWELLNRSEYQGANYREISLLEEVLTL